MNIQIAVSLLLIALFLATAAYNGLIFIRERRGDPTPSVIPILGGIFGAVGLWHWPYHDLSVWAWAPLLLDYGCAHYVAAGTIQEVRRAWRFRESNCFARLVGESSEKNVEIRLYKGGRMLLDETFRNPQKFGSFSSSGKWTSSDSGSGYILSIWGAAISIEERAGQWAIKHESGWFRKELRLSPMILAAVTEKGLARRMA